MFMGGNLHPFCWNLGLLLSALQSRHPLRPQRNPILSFQTTRLSTDVKDFHRLLNAQIDHGHRRQQKHILSNFESGKRS